MLLWWVHQAMLLYNKIINLTLSFATQLWLPTACSFSLCQHCSHTAKELGFSFSIKQSCTFTHIICHGQNLCLSCPVHTVSMWNHTLFAWEHILRKAEEICRAKQRLKRRNYHIFPHCWYYLLFLFPHLLCLWPLLLGPCQTKKQPLMGAECSLVWMSQLLGPSLLSTGIP